MVTDKQVRRLKLHYNNNNSIEKAAAFANMDSKTAKKYLAIDKIPSEMKTERYWRTRVDPFADAWDEVEELLNLSGGLQAKTIFEFLQEKYPGKFKDIQLRTLQNRIKQWRALEGESKEVIFPQIHYPGELSQSDFTCMNSLGITIQGQSFNHLIYHFVLTYSNWETGSICFSESFEALSDGFQKALWTLGVVPKYHQSDNLSAAVNNLSKTEEYTDNYQKLLNHYRVKAKRINPGKANENGDVEQSHYRFKNSVEQALMLRGGCDFSSRETYEKFLSEHFLKLNFNRRENLKEEISVMKNLPSQKLDAEKRIKVKVGKSSTVHIQHNTYSVHSRLIGEWVEARIKSEKIEIWYAQKCIDILSRLRGSGKFKINYFHIIDSLIRKPGAFENYRYKRDLFPSSRFRMAYDILSTKEYLQVLYLSFKNGETLVDNALMVLLSREEKPIPEKVKDFMNYKVDPVSDVTVRDVDLSEYDSLLGGC